MNIIDKKISSFIYNQPDVAATLLEKFGYEVKKPLTLPSITDAMFKALYNNPSKEFLQEVEFAIAQEGYSNFEPITMGVSAGLSILSSFLGAKQAKKQLETQEKIAMANLSQQQLLAEEQIRTGAETERTKILLQTLKEYQTDLQVQSTQRLKDVWIYVGMVAVSISIIVGTVILLSPNKNN